MKNHRELGVVLRALLLCGMVYVPAVGEELRIGTSADWREWQRPGDAIEISRGKAGPRFVRRDIDVVANAVGSLAIDTQTAYFELDTAPNRAYSSAGRAPDF